MIRNYSFDSIELKNVSLFKFNQIIEAWKINFLQLRPGEFLANLSQIIYQDFQLGYAKFNIAVKQEGYSPKGVWTFAFVNDTKIYWRNYEVEPNSVIIYAPGSEINAVSEAGFEVVTFSVSEQYLIEVAENLGLEAFVESLKSIEILVSENILWTVLRGAVLEEMSNKLHSEKVRTDDSFKESFSTRLLFLLKESSVSSIKVSGKKRLKLLHDAEQYIVQNITDHNTVSTVASSLNVSERTLLYAFKKRFAMGPKAYMLILKLNHAYHVLHLEKDKTPVSSIARASGFWHMGQFAKDFKNQFGILPSQI